MGQVITVRQKLNQIHVQQKNLSITVYAQEPIMTRFSHFDFTATEEDQTEFGPLDSTPVQMVALYINGTPQNIETGDYSVSAKIITLSEGVNIGDHVFGVYQEVGSA